MECVPYNNPTDASNTMFADELLRNGESTQKSLEVYDNEMNKINLNKNYRQKNRRGKRGKRIKEGSENNISNEKNRINNTNLSYHGKKFIESPNIEDSYNMININANVNVNGRKDNEEFVYSKTRSHFTIPSGDEKKGYKKDNNMNYRDSHYANQATNERNNSYMYGRTLTLDNNEETINKQKLSANIKTFECLEETCEPNNSFNYSVSNETNKHQIAEAGRRKGNNISSTNSRKGNRQKKK